MTTSQVQYPVLFCWCFAECGDHRHFLVFTDVVLEGSGMLTIACILAETNEFAEFSKISHLISFSGYDVKIKKSGKLAGKPKLPKQGSKYIRRAMYILTTAIARRNVGPIYEFYQRLLVTHSIKMKAHVAVQKKLLTYMYILWNRKERFDPDIIRKQRKEHQKKGSPTRK